jgi:putative ABC transport system substrate-binding protein
MTTRMRRRAFARGLAIWVGFLAAFCIPGASDAQQPGSPRRIGVLLVGFSLKSKEALEFRHALRDAGYEEGRDVVIEWQSANGDYDRLSELAAGLVQRKLDVIVVSTTRGVRAVKHATSIIPIVMVVGDPVESGLVANLGHPGGNVTGVSTMGAPELWAKRLQLLKETIPQLTRVAVLWNPATPLTPWQAKTVEGLKAVAPALPVQLSFVTVRTSEQIGPALSAVDRARPQALCVLAGAQLDVHRKALLGLASKAGLPAMYSDRRFVDEGGLMSYAANSMDHWRRAAAFVDKILKGAKPGDLPIEQPTKFEFVVNLRTAKAMGLAIPQSVLLQADDVIR